MSFVLKRWAVSVQAHGCETLSAKSRGHALSKAWQCDAFNEVSFKDFLRMAHCWQVHTVPEQFGDPITVDGRPAFFVERNRAYVLFVRPDSDNILSAHPYDVTPESYRPEAYRTEQPA